MNSRDVGEDAAFFLYLVPIAAAIIYGVYEWDVIGHGGSYTMPTNAYLIVSKDPYLFLLSLVAICAAVVVELRSAPLGERQNVVSEHVTRMQVLAIIVLIISFAAGLSVAGYSDLAGGLANFLAGRYALIYAFFLLGISILISSRQFMGKVGLSFIAEFVGLLLIALSPIILYGGTKLGLSFTESGIAAIMTLAIGLILFASKSIILARTKTKQKASATQSV